MATDPAHLRCDRVPGLTELEQIAWAKDGIRNGRRHTLLRRVEHGTDAIDQRIQIIGSVVRPICQAAIAGSVNYLRVTAKDIRQIQPDGSQRCPEQFGLNGHVHRQRTGMTSFKEILIRTCGLGSKQATGLRQRGVGGHVDRSAGDAHFKKPVLDCEVK